MKLYFAASFLKEDIDSVGRTGHPDVLFSYHYYGTSAIEQLKEWRKQYKFKLFIDSGAFSAFTSGVKIDLKEYIEFLKQLKPEQYAVLDDLTDPEMTLKNQRTMERAGLTPLPTFHIGEPLKYLDKYLNKYEYMAFGGMVGAQNVDNWLKSIWSYVYKRQPKLKVHGFGLTTQPLIQPYPFYSVDSSSYLATPRYGQLPLWSSKKGTMYNVQYWKYCREHGLNYSKNESMSLEHRDHSIQLSCQTFIQMIKHVNTYQKKTGFAHLTEQYGLFKK